MSRRPLFLIELNEVSFDLVERYVAEGRLPTFARLIERHGLARTTSESRYEELEPWIQWVTAHTGKTLAEHGVFRLGDSVHSDLAQIWERLEARGLKVGALSPMNATNRARAPAFFLPDPWTPTEVTATPLVRRLHGAVCQAVNDNAEARLTPGSAVWLTLGLLRYASPRNWGRYLALAVRAFRGRPWSKAVFLDLLFSDLFCALCRRERVDFASLFLNSAAHIQHHYLHSSAVADGRAENPDWYCAAGVDPVLEAYEAYDRILAQIQARFPGHRLMIATGLHQEAHEAPVFYWRLKNHAAFLERLGVEAASVSPRMSRDFVAEFETEEAAERAAAILEGVRAHDGRRLFEVDNRGRSLFVTLGYPNDIPAGAAYLVGNRQFENLRDDVAFVAIKNGEHDGTGYFLDTALSKEEAPREFPLTGLPERILHAFA